MDRLLSVVASVYNKEKALEDFCRGATGVLKGIVQEYKLIFVDNRSGDQSLSILERLVAGGGNVEMVSFSGNFGHEAAMIAGLDYSRRDGIICMDADPQHLPECIPGILECFERGYEVVDVVRTRNKTMGPIENITSSGFYWLINHISGVHFEANASSFFVISHHITQVLKGNCREKVHFLRSYVQNVGPKRTAIEHEARAKVAGESKYNIKKLFVLSINTILCFSNMPLKLGIYTGIFSALLGLLVMIYPLFTRGGAPSGYATIVVLVCSMFAMIFVIIGIIGEYITILFTELKDRSIYTTDRTESFEEIGK